MKPTVFQPSQPDFASLVSQSFAAQPMMVLLGARLKRVEPGVVDVELPFTERLTQHNGYLHGGTISTIGDTACGYAGYSLIPSYTDILTVEFKINYLSPGVGDRFVAEGKVLRMGKSIIVAQADVIAFQGENQKHIATMLATLMCMRQ